MSTLKMQESVPDNELSHLRKQAAEKDNRYATLENELFKRNNELLAAKGTLDETLYKLRNEADRALKLELDLSRRSEDLRTERLTRQNLESSLKAVSVKLTSEELASKHLQLELESYASRTASQHQLELKHLQYEKTTLESRVRALEAQSQANKPSQLPMRRPRPTAMSGAASDASDARIATLECDLFRAERELADASRTLATTQQDLAKQARLQSDLIVAENGRMRAERVAKTEKANAESVRETLTEREAELEYWRNMAGESSANEDKMEEMVREQDEAVKKEMEMRRSEAMVRRQMEDLEKKAAGLVMEKEEALEALHRLQAESRSSSSTEDVSNIVALRTALAEREAALLNARQYASELQQMYRDTLSACENAEARVHDLERPTGNALPLIIVSPPPSPSPPTNTPFLSQAQPTLMMSPEDEAVVARLLSAIERLRGERDALRRELHFTKVEHRIASDMLGSRLDTAQSELRRLEEDAAVPRPLMNGVSGQSDAEIRGLTEQLRLQQLNIEAMEAELASRSANPEVCSSERAKLQIHLQEDEKGEKRLLASRQNDSRIAISSLIVVQHLWSALEDAETFRQKLVVTCTEQAEARDSTLAQPQVLQSRDGTQEILRGELATGDDRLSDALKAMAERDIQINDTRSQLPDLQFHDSTLQSEIAVVRDELNAAEVRYSPQQLSTLFTADHGVVEALKSQLEVVEQRVLRRTEQIGMQQHDIKRLETNLRVAEDTIGELAAELETLTQERACLVEDCAQARESRDESHRRVEELEVEVETFAKEHDELEQTNAMLRDARMEVATNGERIEAMVHVVAESMTRSKALHAELALTAVRLEAVESDYHSAEAGHLHARAEVERLTSELEAAAVMLRQKTGDVEALTHQLGVTKDETRRLSAAFESLERDVQSHEQDLSGQTHHLAVTVKELEERLAAAQTSEDALSQELEAAQDVEMDLRARFEKFQDEFCVLSKEAERQSSTIASLEEALEIERSAHSETLKRARESGVRLGEFEAQSQESQRQHALLEAQHADIVKQLTAKQVELTTFQAESRAVVASCKSLELDIHRLKAEHSDEILVLRSQLDESVGQTNSLHAQLQAASDAITEFESDIEASIQRYDAAQVEIRGLEHALVGARTQLDEHDASIQALQREKTELQVEHTRLETELERSITKYQYVEQQAKRSDHDATRLKSEVERLREEATKFDEAAQAAEINLSFKSAQFEQKLAMMQRELKKQLGHRQCQETMSELTEKNEYLEEMLRMKSVEIEENDDRFIEALKEKKRLNSKVENLTRKVQNLQTKLAAATTASVGPSQTIPAVVPTSRPKTPSPPVLPPMPSVRPSTRPPTRIPSSPAVALRARTPEPSRRAFASRLTTPEPPLPSSTQMLMVNTPGTAPLTSYAPPPAAPSTPLSSGSRKRRAPDDFDPPAPVPAQVVVASSGNSTPRQLRRPTNDSRSGFTPIRNADAVATRPPLSHPLPLRRVTTPLSESTNSPKGIRALGLGKPAAISKPPVRSWLSRTRAPTTAGGDARRGV